jgi:hypothetical protein
MGTDSNDESNRKLGSFVTNKYLVVTLVALTMSMGGYIFNGKDRTNEAQAARLDLLQLKSQALEVELTQQKITLALKLDEVIRRLDRIENQMYAGRRAGP